MASIFASKFYDRTKIQSAVNDPKNRELVQQVASYLSKEDQAKLVSMMEQEKKDREQPDTADMEFEDPGAMSQPSFGGGRGGPSFGHSNMEGGPSKIGDLSDDLRDLPDANSEISDVDDMPNPEATSEPDIDSSTKIYQMGDKVVAATQTTEELTEEGIQSLLTEKGADGVRRVDFLDDGEIWIYYLDTTNLNTIMESAISAITNKYKFIEFNRLARTSNAIVFTFKQA